MNNQGGRDISILVGSYFGALLKTNLVLFIRRVVLDGMNEYEMYIFTNKIVIFVWCI